MNATKIKIVDIEIDEMPITLRLPFRYGATTLKKARQALVTVRIRADGGEAVGQAAELMAPKWFDKSLNLSDEDNVAQLRMALEMVRARYLGTAEYLTAFGLHATHDADHMAEAASAGLNNLVAGFGSALIDKGVIAALCRLEDSSFFDVVRANAIGLSSMTAPDLDGVDLDRFLQGLHPATSIVAKHTVGATDALTDADVPEMERVEDGLPQSLVAAIRHYGLTAFKIKLTGDAVYDGERLRRIAAVLAVETQSPMLTLDGNEHFKDPQTFHAYWDDILSHSDLRPFLDTVRFIEQPITRDKALERPLGRLSEAMAFVIDESDEWIGAFPRAVDLGYRGVTSKSCKGVYRSLLNCARIAVLNSAQAGPAFFMSAEDLSAQAGLAVEQDLALATLIGCEATERNGHYFGDGHSTLSPEAIDAWREARPGLYAPGLDRLSLRIDRGRIDLSALFSKWAYGQQQG